MSPKDFEFAAQITDQMKWNLTAADFEFMIELEPHGCFVLLEDSERIGLATTVNFGTIAWFGNLIINKSHRKKGAGSQLVTHSIKYLTNKRVRTIGLYAYMNRIPFYEKLGFKYDSEFTVLEGRGCSLQVDSAVREAKKQDLQDIIEFDRSCFGASRRRLLKPIILDPDNLCYISAEGERIIGYVVAKVYRQIGEIGPLICRKGIENVAFDLLRKVLSRLKGYEVSMCIPNAEGTVLSSLRTLGFTESFRVARMFFGSPIVNYCICVAESLERG
jgi:ribosomal protein S18 acetylase RimI-like enzyme